VKAGFDEPLVQNFGSSRDVMVRMAPDELNALNGRVLLGGLVDYRHHFVA
jgi:hypothetical protein